MMNIVLKKKIECVLNAGLIPIYCIGEDSNIKKKGKTKNHLLGQLSKTLPKKNKKKIVVAYEPIWAIGTGVTASSDQAEEIHKFIREIITQKYGRELANNISILYGGSCKPTNAREIFSKDNIDGGLIGGASLNAESFVEIIKSF